MEIFHSDLGKTIWSMKNMRVCVQTGSEILSEIGKAIKQHLGLGDENSEEEE